MAEAPKQETVVAAVEMILRRACAEAEIPLEGPWSLQSMVTIDLQSKTIVMFCELQHRPELAAEESLKVM